MLLSILVIISGVLIYLQFGRDVKVISTMSNTRDQYYEERMIITANKLIIPDKKKLAEKLIERCKRNDFNEVLFSYDILGYPNRVTITVYPNEFLRKLHKGSWMIEYEAEEEKNTCYNIKDHSDKFHIRIIE